MCAFQVQATGSGNHKRLQAEDMPEDEDRTFQALAAETRSKFLVWWSFLKDAEQLQEWQKNHDTPLPLPNPHR